MSLSQKIVAALDARPDNGALPCDVTVEDEPNRLTLHLTALGPVGLACDSLDFATAVRSEWSPDALRAWGDRIAARVTYLMEPLFVHEHDRDGGEVALRSHTPTARGEHRSYYEIRLNRLGELRLSRTTFDDETRRRRPAACQLTRELLERLADDLAASVA
jgi:hypothetical protein